VPVQKTDPATLASALHGKREAAAKTKKGRTDMKRTDMKRTDMKTSVFGGMRSCGAALAIVAALMALTGTARAAVIYHTGVVATASSAEGSRDPANLTNSSGFNLATMTVTSDDPNNTMWNTTNTTKAATWVMFDLGKVTDIGNMIVFNYNDDYIESANRRFVTADVWWTASVPTVSNPTVATPGNWTRLVDDQTFAEASYTTSYNTPTQVALNLTAARYVLMNDIVNGGGSWGGNSYGLSEVVFTTIPEPGSLGMLGATAIALLLRRRFRR